MKLLSLVFLIFCVNSCATVSIPDFESCAIELPYSGDGYCRRVVSQRARRIPKDTWVKERRTMVCLPHDSYRQLKIDLYKHCYDNRCKQALDSVGRIFEELDKAVGAIR